MAIFNSFSSNSVFYKSVVAYENVKKKFFIFQTFKVYVVL